jgi:hypothetical protein
MVCSLCSPELVTTTLQDFTPSCSTLRNPFTMTSCLNTLYHDLVAGAMTGGVSCRSIGDTLVVDFAPQVDSISQAVLDVKLRYLI